MKFTYQARNQSGKPETGAIEANSKEAAAVLLQKYHLFVTSLKEEQTEGLFSKNIRLERKVSTKDLTIFFRQLSVMLESRVSVVQSLASLAAQTKKQKFKKIIADVSSLVQEGTPLSGALSAYPKVFRPFYINLVKSGEASGNIAGALAYISEHLEREDDIVSQLRQAMVYPIFVACVLFVVMGIIMVEVMPRIVELVKESSSHPPFFTVLMLNFYAFLASWWWVLLLGFLAIAISLVVYFRTKEGKRQFDRLALKIPFISSLLKKVFLSRFCSNISTLMGSGISINKALEITENTVNNIAYQEIIVAIGKDVSEGEPMSTSLAKYPEYFPSFVVQMMKVGEETGKLDKTLVEIVNFYQKEIKRSIDLFSSLIEPIMIIFLGVVVAILAVSVLSPLYGALGNV